MPCNQSPETWADDLSCCLCKSSAKTRSPRMPLAPFPCLLCVKLPTKCEVLVCACSGFAKSKWLLSFTNEVGRNTLEGIKIKLCCLLGQQITLQKPTCDESIMNGKKTYGLNFPWNTQGSKNIRRNALIKYIWGFIEIKTFTKPSISSCTKTPHVLFCQPWAVSLGIPSNRLQDTPILANRQTDRQTDR